MNPLSASAFSPVRFGNANAFQGLKSLNNAQVEALVEGLKQTTSFGKPWSDQDLADITTQLKEIAQTGLVQTRPLSARFFGLGLVNDDQVPAMIASLKATGSLNDNQLGVVQRQLEQQLPLERGAQYNKSGMYSFIVSASQQQ